MITSEPRTVYRYSTPWCSRSTSSTCRRAPSTARDQAAHAAGRARRRPSAPSARTISATASSCSTIEQEHRELTCTPRAPSTSSPPKPIDLEKSLPWDAVAALIADTGGRRSISTSSVRLRLQAYAPDRRDRRLRAALVRARPAAARSAWDLTHASMPISSSTRRRPMSPRR